MCDILREEKQIKAGTSTEGWIKKERKKEGTSWKSNCHPYTYFSSLPPSHCNPTDKLFFFDSKIQTLKRRQEMLSSYPFLIVLLTRHGRELFQTTLAGNLISFREGLFLFSSGQFSPYPLLFFRVTTLSSRSFVFLCLTCVICQVMWKS